jgi:Methylamine utilisation protein MauE
LAATYFAFRIGLGGVCVLAGLEKARAPRDFFHGVERYRLVPRSLAPAAGGGLIAVELALGVLLVSDVAPVGAAAGAIALFGLFAAALAVSLVRSNRAPCHCFGASELETISPLALLRALGLTGLGVALLVLALGDPRSLTGGRMVAGLLLAAALVAVARLSGLLPLAWSFLRAPATMFPTPTHRVSFRHQPLHVPLFPEELR